MKRQCMLLVLGAMVAGLVTQAQQRPAAPRASAAAAPIDVTVSEGTSMSGDPLADIANTVKVRKVMANGRMHDVAQLIAPKR